MKKTLLYFALAAALITGTAVAGTTWYASGYEIQLLNRATPLADAPLSSEKLALNNVKKVRLSICTCTSSACSTRGGNLTGGTMQCWYNSPVFGWVINPDLALSVGSVGQACRVFSDMESPGGNTGGDMFCQASSVTAASGTHLEVHLEGVGQ